MEFPALAVFSYFFLAGSIRQSAVTWLFFSLWLLHYTNRTLFFPFRIKTQEKRMPALIVVMGFGFNFANGFLNGYYFGFLAPHYPLDWFLDLRFILGVLLFFFGIGMNWWSDTILIRLRISEQKKYSIPYGGMFRYVSSPNYFGEIVEWGGFVLMVWSLPALSFFVWTVVNLIPRALDHHRWYTEQFEDYPDRRRALFPFLL
jgi:3-oxo-5-alpha-steroid 4-dehydrogenase 1